MCVALSPVKSALLAARPERASLSCLALQYRQQGVQVACIYSRFDHKTATFVEPKGEIRETDGTVPPCYACYRKGTVPSVTGFVFVTGFVLGRG